MASSDRRWCSWTCALSAAVVLMALAGCNFDPPRTEAATEPRRLLAERTLDWTVLGWTADGKRLIYRSPAEPPDGPLPPEPFSLFLLDVDTGRVQHVGDKVRGYAEEPRLGAPGSAAPLVVLLDDTQRMLLFWPDTDERQNLAGQVEGGYVIGHAVVGDWLVVLTLENGTSALWAGPPRALARIDVAPLIVWDLQEKIDRPAGKHELLVRAGAGPAEAAVWKVALDQRHTTAVVPARQIGIATPWPGISPMRPALDDTTPGYVSRFWQFCWPTPSPLESPKRCVIMVDRERTKTAADGLTTHTSEQYLSLSPEEREVYLPGISYVHDQPLVVWANPDSGVIHTFNLETWGVRSCPTGFDRPRVFPFGRPGGHGVLFTLSAGNGPLFMDSDGAASCVRLPEAPRLPNQVVTSLELAWFAFSPKGTRFVWSLPRRTDAVFWADGNGQNAQLLVDGVGVSRFSFRDEDLLLYERFSPDATGLGAVDLTASPLHERPLADQVFGPRATVSKRWLLQGTGFHSANRNGNLSLVDTDTGDNATIDTAVTEYWMAPVLGPDGQPRANVPVVYTVRGREPSARDGVWVVHLRPDALVR